MLVLWGDYSLSVSNGAGRMKFWRPEKISIKTNTCVFVTYGGMDSRWCNLLNFHWSRAWMADLPRDVAERIAYRNGDAIFGNMMKP